MSNEQHLAADSNAITNFDEVILSGYDTGDDATAFADSHPEGTCRSGATQHARKNGPPPPCGKPVGGIYQ
ncbi:hypothetical protein GCM10009767_28590 [Kocuria aegyptia]|uniref:Uncharacterized protein n=1 Tax=Kocuria aegyptia TaxID=330943 RepID=A0ABN2KZ84_9MICC